MEGYGSRSTLDRQRTPVLRRHRRGGPPSALARAPLTDEDWPADDGVQAYLVGARPDAASSSPSPGPARNFARVRSSQSLAGSSVAGGGSRPLRLGSHREGGRVSSVFASRGQRGRALTKRVVTDMEKTDVFADVGGGEMENSCYSIAATVVEERGRAALAKAALDVGRRGDVFQGYCRMAWFAGLRCTRFLRLVRGVLQCYDSNIRKRLWDVDVEGARVRIQLAQSKIVLNKLKCGYLIEFYLYDPTSCREWGAALLRASVPGGIERDLEY